MFFIFVFLAANLCSQILLKSAPHKNFAMLIFSLVFYSWAGPKYLVLLLGMSAISWAGALKMGPAGKNAGAGRKRTLVVTVGACLIILGIFKYTGFFLENVQAFFGVPEIIPEIALPIGISFYTFQLISYVADVYRGDVAPQKKYLMVLLYASLFHQCIAGPIVRYRDIESDLIRREAKLPEISRGISRFTIGLAKKAILANGCAAVCDSFFELPKEQLSELPVLGVWLGAIFFTLQIYLDFSAYSDMAIGMGLMCGLHYKENFNYPYISNTVTEFWRRWHISLSSFFRDYVYIPLGGNRCSKGRQVFNIFAVWALTGLWHGASWNFVIWGLYFGLLLCIERFVLNLKKKEAAGRQPKGALAHITVLFLVVLSWVIFKFTDSSLMITALRGLFGLNGAGLTNFSTYLSLKNNIFFLAFCVIACTPLGRNLRALLKSRAEKPNGGLIFRLIDSAWEILHPVLFLILSAMALAGESYNPFLYFRF